ncbi:MAG: hypothetical protein V4635_09450 [Bacteroidota bacterium]
MEIEILNDLDVNAKGQSKLHRITSFTPLIQNPSLQLVGEINLTMHEKVHEPDVLVIYKIQFVASCKIEGWKNEIVLAFYMEGNNEWFAHPISQLPDEYYVRSHSSHLIDYKSYTENCKLMDKKILTFKEYFEEVKSGNLDVIFFA